MSVAQRPRRKLSGNDVGALGAGLTYCAIIAMGMAEKPDEKRYDTVNVACTGPEPLTATFRNATISKTGPFTHIMPASGNALTVAQGTPCKITTHGPKP